MTTTLTPNPTSPAALRRKVERLQAQLAALQTFLDRDRKAEYSAVMRNADMAMRMDQARKILEGGDA